MWTGQWAVLLVISSLFAAPLLPLAEEEEEQTEEHPTDGTEIALSDKQLTGLHARFDRDDDGKVSLEELKSYAKSVTKDIAARDVKSILEELDLNKDGKLSLEEHTHDTEQQSMGGDHEEMQEFQQWMNAEAAKFAAADEDGDGMLDLKEMTALFYPETHDGVLGVATEELLRQKDKNQDGVLSSMEFWDAMDDHSDEAAFSEEEVMDFNELDRDGDGFLDLEDLRSWESGDFHLQATLKKLLEATDKDRDNHVTLKELLSSREQLSISDAHYHLIEWAEHAEL